MKAKARRKYALRDLLDLFPPVPWRLLETCVQAWIVAAMIGFLVLAGLVAAGRL